MPPKRVRPVPAAPVPVQPAKPLVSAWERAAARIETAPDALASVRLELLAAVAFAKNTMRDMADAIAERDTQIAYLTALESKEPRFAELQTKAENLAVEVANRDTRIAELAADVKDVKETLEQHKDRIDELENELEEQRCEEAELVERVAKLTEKLLGHEDVTAEPIEKYELRRAVEDLRALH